MCTDRLQVEVAAGEGVPATRSGTADLSTRAIDVTGNIMRQARAV
jgi:hypothetical protein